MGLDQWLNVSWARSSVNSSEDGVVCGNGFREEGEGCDDANVEGGDGGSRAGHADAEANCPR
ncbi:hypothetical protein T484DRAFT_1818332 [Baffinella frigidus]|nr:hypothetical protein T484DRAFT_1818332 [Cryptophyta sp. CCMP2293]